MANRSTNTGKGLNTRIDGRLLAYARNTFLRGGAGTNYSNLLPIVATGGNQTPANGLAPGNGYKYHTFTSPGTFTISSGLNFIEFIIVGGGGGGNTGGGGGAGGIAYSSGYFIGPGTYPITVGPGGSTASQGGDSTFDTINGKGGGGGPGAAPGGSGGGAGFPNPSVGGTATQPTQPSGTGAGSGTVLMYGNPGGNRNDVGGGGGGAGQAGTPDNAGPGGSGQQFPQFTGPLIGVPALNPLNGYFAGGGGAGTRNGSPGPLNNGGAGGGGAGGGDNNTPGYNGTTNSGGGGGGGSTQSGVGNSPGGSGGSGIVVLRYLA